MSKIPFSLISRCPHRSTHTLRTYYAPRRHASSWNPFSWMRDRIKMRELLERRRETPSRSAEDIAAAREEAQRDEKRSVFEDVPEAILQPSRTEPEDASPSPSLSRRRANSHTETLAHVKSPHRKVNLLANQIAGLPIDYAILQMQFSEKRASNRIYDLLLRAKENAINKQLDSSRLIISEAWVVKGPKISQKVDIKGRGRFGVKTRNATAMTVVLKEGKTVAEEKAALRARRLKKIVSAAVVRENKPIRNPATAWQW